MSVTCPTCVMANLLFAPVIGTKSMASLARMGRATAGWEHAPPWRSSALTSGDQVGGQAQGHWHVCLSPCPHAGKSYHPKGQCFIVAEEAFCPIRLSFLYSFLCCAKAFTFN